MAEHALLRELISDRDKLFMLRFWKALITQFSIRHKLSTAYYSQIDGQTKRINQILE